MLLEHESYGSVMDALPATPKGHGGETSRGVSPSQHHDPQDEVVPYTPLAPSTPAASDKDAKKYRNNVTFSPATPFFIMDWLKDVNPEDLELARKILQTPNKSRSFSDADKDKQALKKDLFASSSRRYSSTSAIATNTSTTNTPSKLMTGQRNSQSTTSIIPQTPLSPVDKTKSTQGTPPKYSGFHRRSITIGNGWNAKGLQKAKQGQWQDALACWENALEIRKQILGDHHVDVANTYNNMGIALGRLHLMEQAMTSLHAALEIRTLHYGRPGKQQERATGQQDDSQEQQDVAIDSMKGLQEVAATLHNLANVHQQAGDLKTALEYFDESMQLLQQILGKDHAHVARAHVAIGHLHYEANEIRKAQQAYQTGLNIMERASGQERGVVENEIASIRADLQEVEALLKQQKQQQDDDEKDTTKSVISAGEEEEKKD